MLYSRSLLIVFCFSFIILFMGCNEENIITPLSNLGSGLNDNLYSLARIDQDPIIPKQPVGEPGTSTDTVDNKIITCTVQLYKQADSYNEQIALNPLTDVIWPGSIINGATIMTGEYRPITASRGPLTFSISNPFFSPPFRIVEIPTLSSVREAIGEILTQEVSGDNPAQVSFEIVSIYSEEQLKLALGATYDDGLFRISGQFDFQNTSKYTKILVKFIQVFYTLDIDIPEQPADFFASSVTWDDLKNQINQNISPTVVSTIAYGRMGLFSVESSYDFEKVSAMLEATYDSAASFNASGQYDSILEQTTTKGTIIGGSSNSAVNTVNGYGAFIDFIVAGGSWSPENPGAPLAYKLRYLNDFGIANVVLTSEYFIRTCEEIIIPPVPTPGRISCKNINGPWLWNLVADWDIGGNREQSSTIQKGLGESIYLDIPAGATNIEVYAKLWNEDRAFTRHYPTPVVKCFEIGGAWNDPWGNEVNCP